MNKMIFILATAMAMAGCRQQGAEEEAPASVFETMTVSKQDITLEQSYPAQIEGRQSIKIIPRVEGYLRQICVKMVRIDQPQLWDFDHPNLYDFTFTIPGSDELKEHFGLCDFSIVGRHFILNGEQVRLPGIEDMPGSHPDYGMAEPRSYINRTADLIKDLNTTITRFHWPQDKDMLDAMDERGILVTEQIPWWQQPAPRLNDELRQNAHEQLEEIIEADYNHPCIFVWGLANEVRGIHEDLKYLKGIAKHLDPRRANIAFSHETYKDYDKNPSCVLDLPTWNEYTGAWHGPHREDLPDRLSKIDSALHDRPLMITEA